MLIEEDAHDGGHAAGVYLAHVGFIEESLRPRTRDHLVGGEVVHVRISVGQVSGYGAQHGFGIGRGDKDVVVGGRGRQWHRRYGQNDLQVPISVANKVAELDEVIVDLILAEILESIDAWIEFSRDRARRSWKDATRPLVDPGF